MQNVNKIKQEVNVKIVVATKNRSISEIRQALASGISILGESRVQEAEQKCGVLKDYFKSNNIRFHFIGHLQTNKAKKAVEMFDLIQSIDTIKLAHEIDKRSKEINKIQEVLVQVNIGKEPQKHGVMPKDLFSFIKKLMSYDSLKVEGLMCIPPVGDPKPYFKEMKILHNQTGLQILSMGMSSDYKIAIEEGSNMVRIGRGIFGERKN